MINLKQKLRKKELTIGSWITLGSPYIAEIMAQSGFDWLTICMEHTAITMTEAQQMIQAIELNGVVPLVRVGANDATIIKQVLDAGAHGVIVPMVNSALEAKNAVDAANYPPHGKRGVGLGRAQKYGFGFESYKNWAEKNSVVIVQIEHIDAVNNLEEILSVEGVDGLIIGPYDLSGSLGKPGDFNDPLFLDALKRVNVISSHSRKPKGFHCIANDPSAVQAKIDEGYTFIAVSVDEIFLGSGCRDILNALDRNAITNL